jgi:hypothetical protein
MKFNQYQTTYAIIKKKARKELGRKFVDLSIDEFYTKSMDGAPDIMCYNHACAEHMWIKCGKPYYKLWPGIAKALLNLKLDIPISMVKLPQKALLIKLPEGQDFLKQDDFACKVIIAAYNLSSKVIIVLSDWGEYDQLDSPVYYVQQLHINDDTTVEKSIPPGIHPTANIGLVLSSANRLNIVRLLSGICLLGDDSELIKPEVLSRDQSKFMKTGDISLIEKAKRRGKYGFEIGNISEISPHYRNPHLCLMWTGKGRKIPKIVIRKGSIIKRKIAATIPFGYDVEDDDDIKASVGERTEG